MKTEFFISFVKHIRHIPKRYIFDYRFFWTKFDLDELDELHETTPFFSRNSFNLVSYYDDDHINLGYQTTRENLQAWLLEQGITERIRKIELITNPRILGYTFNPVSFYFIETFLSPYVVIEIGNTFKEKKPYLVKPENLINGEWIYTTPKHFYISPFTSVENTMTFRIKRTKDSLVINIDDFNKSGVLEVQALFTGRNEAWNNKNLIRLFFSYPFITLRIIASIHYHAFKLYLLKIPFWKKTDDDHLQTNLYEYREKSFRKKTKAL